MNKLLLNMKNKVKVIDGAISMCYALMNGENIVLTGLHTLSINKGNNSNDDFYKKISLLEKERENLLAKINRMEKC